MTLSYPFNENLGFILEIVIPNIALTRQVHSDSGRIDRAIPLEKLRHLLLPSGEHVLKLHALSSRCLKWIVEMFQQDLPKSVAIMRMYNRWTTAVSY